MDAFLSRLAQEKTVIVRQRRELAELIGFETRNKYEINTEGGSVLGFAAEQSKSILGFLLRQWLGHWRSFEVHIFDTNRQVALIARHPFRFFFQAFEVMTPDRQLIGRLEQRFSIFGKKFDVQNARGQVLFQMRSPLWRLWTFRFTRNSIEHARLEKKWGGILKEVFTDQDQFRLNFVSSALTHEERALLLASSFFVDLQYFEKKA